MRATTTPPWTEMTVIGTSQSAERRRASNRATQSVHAEGVTSAEGQRVLVLAPQPFYQDRGTPIALRQVLTSLSEAGAEVDLLTFPGGEDIELPGLSIFRVPNPFNFRPVPIGLSVQKTVLDALMIPAAWRRIRRGRYDCIHAVEEAVFPAIALGRMYGLPVIYDMQSSLPEHLEKHALFSPLPVQRLLRRIERWAIRKSEVVVCSAGLGEYVGDVDPSTPVWEWIFLGQNAEARPNEVHQLRRELEISRDSQVVLYSGNFACYQGVSRLLAAAQLLCRHMDRVVFVLVGGDPTEVGALAAPIAQLESQGSLRIIARQPRARMPSFLSMADLLVSPRDEDPNLPLKVFDYLAAGKPIVATDSVAHRKVLDDTRAVLVEPSGEAFAEAIEDLLEDESRAKRLAEAARRYASSHLGVDAFTSQVFEIYSAAGGTGYATAVPRQGALPTI